MSTKLNTSLFVYPFSSFPIFQIFDKMERGEMAEERSIESFHDPWRDFIKTNYGNLTIECQT